MLKIEANHISVPASCKQTKTSSFQIIESLDSFDKSTCVPTSKSVANRLLILGAVCKERVVIENLSMSTDTKTLVEVLKIVGLIITELGNNTIAIDNSFPACEKHSDTPIDIDSGDGGTTNRFLAPLLSLGKNKYRLRGSGDIHKRPFDEYSDVFNNLGVLFNYDPRNDFFIEIKGPANFTKSVDNIYVDCSRSTQFASGLLLAYSQIDSSIVNRKFSLKNLKHSKSYLDLTNLWINKIQNGVRHFIVPADFSSLAYPAVLAAVCGKVVVNNAFCIDSSQADSLLFDLFKKLNIDFFIGEKGLTVNQGKFFETKMEFDCSNSIDLVPALVFLGAHLCKELVITGIENLRYKESDRLKEIINILNIFCVRFEVRNSVLTIFGSKNHKYPKVEYISPKDHRMCILASLFMRAGSGGLIRNSECVEKSFPNFYCCL